MTTVHIVKIVHGFDRWAWLCEPHIAELRAKGAEVTIKRPDSFPFSNVKGLTCDRCTAVPS